MIEQVFEAIGRFLNHHFPDYDIYSEYPNRDFDMPAFVIVTTGGNMVKRLSDRTIHRGIDYQNYIVNIFDMDLYSLAETTRELKVRLNRIDLENGDSFRVLRKNSSININEHHATVSFTIPVSEYMELEKLPRMTNLSFKENVNGSEQDFHN